MISCGSGVEALVLAILDGDHALYKVGARLAERGMLPLLQAGLERESLNDYRLGQILDALFAANLNRVFRALRCRPWKAYSIEVPWLHQDTTTLSLYGAYEGGAVDREGTPEPTSAVAPRPAYGQSIAQMSRSQAGGAQFGGEWRWGLAAAEGPPRWPHE